LRPSQLALQLRRAGVVAQRTVRVERAQHAKVVGGELRQVRRPPQPADAVQPFAGTTGLVALQVVEADPGMAVEAGEGRFLARQQGDDAADDQMLEHIGVVAGMEGVAVVHGAVPGSGARIVARRNDGGRFWRSIRAVNLARRALFTILDFEKIPPETSFMSESLLSSRNLAFELYEVLDAEALTQRPRFAEHNRETFDAAVATARSTAEELFAPHNRKNDEHEPQYVDGAAVLIPEVEPALRAFHEAGFLNATRDFESGGMQLPNLLSQACFAHFQAANIATSSYSMLTMGVANLIEAFGSAEQKARYLQPIIDGRFFGTMALTEPHAGSSLSDIRTKAEPHADGSYRIKGNKIFISGGDQPISENIVHMVLARLPDAPPGVKGISLFIVPKFLVNEDGSLGKRNDALLAGLFHKMGWRGTTSTALNFGDNDDCVGYLVGKPHHGLSYMFQMMNEARIGVGMGAIMLGYAGYLYSLDYARNRPQGRPADGKDPSSPQVAIIEHADVRRMLLTQKAYVEGAFDLGLYAARLFDDTQTLATAEERQSARELLDLLTPIVKSWPSEFCLKANELAIQILGGHGYTREYPVEQYYRDNRLNP